ncbi:hypothetical protein LTR48_006828 [Friedmanniomyces endolithicus]|uniref:Uncharacterized protein n=1 Tax=Rachicladosporium monterosium TaxID=1507873 RepID=A0ABR0L862_9PEZI|nr:hypothetical protein LTR48_006828 [Friedmanniomyces endolithicus]KAK5144940.1 hypothetical protein LTR32_003224 [Rachicladosporium monterosium]
MASSSAPTKFTALSTAGKLLEVNMNDVGILLPQDRVRTSIGTQRLNGCTAIVVLGQAIIIAHIAPLPPGSSTTRPPSVTAGDRHFNQMMDDVQTLLMINRAYFPPRTTAWGIFGKFEGSSMKEKEDITTQRFAALGLTSRHIYYNVQLAQTRTKAAAGEVAVVRNDQVAALYVEDEVKMTVDFTKGVTQAPAVASSSASGGTSSTASSAAGNDEYWAYST